jgi:preprotein translocase subunit SecA
VLDGEDIQESVRGMMEEYVKGEVSDGLGHQEHPESAEQLETILEPFYGLFLTKGQIIVPDGGLKQLTAEKLSDKLLGIADQVYAKREAEFGNLPDGTVLMRELERVIMLRVVDEYWMEHIDAMDDLRQGIGLRAYGNVKPIDAYKQEGFDMFEAMVSGIRTEVVRRLFTVRIRKEQTIERKQVAKANVNNVGGDASSKKQPVKKAKKPGRNDPCPCGKWKADGSRPLKYKECCGRNE